MKQNKSAFSLFELILVILISSIMVVYSFSFLKELYSSNKNLQKRETAKVDLLSTKIFLQKHKDNLSKLEYKNNTLYYDGSILLEKVKEFKLNQNKGKISIKINFNDMIIQTWRYSL